MGTTFDPVTNLLVVAIAAPLFLFMWREMTRERAEHKEQTKEAAALHRAELAATKKEHIDDIKAIAARYDQQIERSAQSDQQYRELLAQMVQSIKDMKEAYDISERFAQLESRIAATGGQ